MDFVLSSDIGAVKRNPLYRTFVEPQHGLDTMKFDDFEANTLRYDYERVSNLPEDGMHMFAAVDISEALDEGFVIAADQYVCLFCKGNLVHHMFRECPTLANSCERGRPMPSGR